MNIQTKLFAGFAIVVVISAAMGLNAVKSIHDMSNLTNRLYEHPLMSSNFARSAQANYINMNVSLSLALSSLDASKLDDHIAAAEEFQDEVSGDLEVVEERVLNELGAAIILEIAGLLDQWTEMRETIADAGGSEVSDLTELSLKKNALARLTEEKFDLLIEAATLEGYTFIQSANETNDFTFYIQIVAVLVTVVILFMHPLPADREIDVTNSVIDGPQSVVFDEAENRLHTQKAVMALTMK